MKAVAEMRNGLNKLIVAGALASALVGFAALQADAAVVNSIPGGTIYPLPSLGDVMPDGRQFGIYSAGPQTIAPGIVWTSNVDGGSLYGRTENYGFDGNGNWIDTAMVGLDSALGVMTIAFSTPVAAVGGYLNWSDKGTGATISVYDADHVLIESLLLDGSAADKFYGFAETTNSIAFLTLSDDYIGLRNLTTAVVATPLPAALPLFLGGLGFIGLLGLRKRHSLPA